MFAIAITERLRGEVETHFLLPQPCPFEHVARFIHRASQHWAHRLRCPVDRLPTLSAFRDPSSGSHSLDSITNRFWACDQSTRDQLRSLHGSILRHGFTSARKSLQTIACESLTIDSESMVNDQRPTANGELTLAVESMLTLSALLLVAQAFTSTAQSYCGVRLSGGSSAIDGVLHTCSNNVYYDVCDDGFGANAAQVACRELIGGSAVAYAAAVTDSSTQFLFDEVTCTGQESSLRFCSYTTNHDCRVGESVRLTCRCPTNEYYDINRADCVPVAPAGTSTCGIRLRLATASSTPSGFLEACYTNTIGDPQWGAVCDDGFDDVDAAVACSQMGGSLITWVGQVSNLQFAFAMDNLQCSRYDTSLFTCPGLKGFRNHNCANGENIALACSCPSGQLYSTSQNRCVGAGSSPLPSPEPSPSAAASDAHSSKPLLVLLTIAAGVLSSALLR